MDGIVKFEYFPDERDGPILLFYGSGRSDFKRLLDLAASLGEQGARRTSIAELPGFEAIGGIRVECAVGPDVGLVQVAPDTFEWCLSKKSWKTTAYLIEPFAQREPKSSDGVFQYLGEVGPVQVIVSTIRGW